MVEPCLYLESLLRWFGRGHSRRLLLVRVSPFRPCCMTLALNRKRVSLVALLFSAVQAFFLMMLVAVVVMMVVLVLVVPRPLGLVDVLLQLLGLLQRALVLEVGQLVGIEPGSEGLDVGPPVGLGARRRLRLLALLVAHGRRAEHGEKPGGETPTCCLLRSRGGGGGKGGSTFERYSTCWGRPVLSATTRWRYLLQGFGKLLHKAQKRRALWLESKESSQSETPEKNLVCIMYYYD